MSARTKPRVALQEAILSLKTAAEVDRFLADLCTPAEIEAITHRWWVAQLLDEKKLPYREIYKVTGASVATITRVARFLSQERYHGYRLVLDRCKASA